MLDKVRAPHMAYQFPNNPALGDTHNGYAWQGSYWTRIAEASTPNTEEPTPSVSTSSTEPEETVSTPYTAQPISGSNNTLINLTIPIDLGQLLQGASHQHPDFDYIAPE